MAQSLTTPVVSVATPSLLAPFSGMQTAYNTGKNLQRLAARRDVLSDLKNSGLCHENVTSEDVKSSQHDATNLHEYSLCSSCESFWNDSTSKVSINMD